MPDAKIMVIKEQGPANPGQGLASANEVARLIGTDIERVSASTLTLTNDFHGAMIEFAGACTVTIPAGLRKDFACGWCQGGASAVVFAAGGGVTLASLGSLLSSGGQHAIGGIAAFSLNSFRLYGPLA